MAIPTSGGGQLWPPGGTSNAATLIEGIRAFVRPTELGALSLAATRTYLGITGGSGPAADASDDQFILANHVFGA